MVRLELHESKRRTEAGRAEAGRAQAGAAATASGEVDVGTTKGR